ncbi:MAG: hypothetical protein VCE43_06145, partial [Myxococcota bacterium]
RKLLGPSRISDSLAQLPVLTKPRPGITAGPVPHRGSRSRVGTLRLRRSALQCGMPSAEASIPFTLVAGGTIGSGPVKRVVLL